ncbi:hypothetical protein H5T87_04350 [bacterium]|nr:hypothetical protein [bacterium]
MEKRGPNTSVLVFILVLFTTGKIAFPLKIEKLSISPVIPICGEEIEFRITLINEKDHPLDNINLTVDIVKGGKETRFSKLKIPKIGINEAKKLSLGKWKAKESGLYSLKVIASWQDQTTIGTFPFAVVDRKVEFAWYGTPRNLRWATISTTIEKDYIDEWLWEGRTPLVFKPGVCFWEKHKEAPIEEQVKCWDSIPEGAIGIGIDEYGESESGDKVKSAIKLFKQKNPKRKLALWSVGGLPDDIVSYVDYFLPEVYLNYHNMHLGVLENTINYVKEKNLQRKTLLGLGINYEPEQKTLLTTPEELEAQFKLIKKLCPNILGIGVFYYGSVPSLDKIADSLFYKYFILPVATCKWEIKFYKGKPLIKGEVENIGNMKSDGIEVLLLVDKNLKKTQKISSLKTGERKRFSFELSDIRKGIHIFEIKLRASNETTIIPEEKREAIAFGLSSLKNGDRYVLWLPPYSQMRKNQPLRFTLPSGWRSAKVFLIDRQGNLIREFKTQPNNWGEVIWVDEYIPANEERFYLLEEDSQPDMRQVSKTDFSNTFYRICLNVKQDEIEYLEIETENLLSSPWKFEMEPNYRMKIKENEVEILDGAVFREVKIPFEGEGLSGYSDYIFYHQSPIIEIRRIIKPIRELEIQNAREGARFPQRGGKYQAYPGEDALRVDRGNLIDSNEYRDIYFGYLGASPSPENCLKAGWFDFSWNEPPLGLGVGIIERWKNSKSRTYDVTRYYDGGDWIDIFYIFQTNAKISSPQRSFVLLLPHRDCDLVNGESPILPYYWTEKNTLRKIIIF